MEDNDNYAKKKDDFPESHLHCEICTLKSVSKKKKKPQQKQTMEDAASLGQCCQI
jgi:hypothetical protein